MNAIVCSTFGPPENLNYQALPLKELQENEVKLKVVACSVNFPDLLIIENKYQFKAEPPFSPGSELSGIVEEVGAAVKHLKKGDRVFALSGWGGLAEYINADAAKVFKLPNELDFITGASLMYNFGTSYHALKNRANLKAGETILVLGAAGGVGLAAIELAKTMGATVIAAASTQEKLDVCKQKGADFLINYVEEDLRQKIKEHTGGKGVNVVYDPVGGDFSELALRSMAWNGRFLVVGFAAGNIPAISLNLALLKGIAIVGVFWGRFAMEEPKENYTNLLEIAQLFKLEKIKVHVHKLYNLEEAPQAMMDLRDRKVIGKAVVLIDQELGNITSKPLEVTAPKKEGNKTIFSSPDQVFMYVGKDLEPSSWFKVSQETITAFGKTTHDEQWIHMDPERAKEQSPFGATIAHGYLTVSLLPKFFYEVYEVAGAKMGVNYGSEKVRFLNPVKAGSEIRMVSKLKSASPGPNNSVKMVIEAIIEIKGESKPACIAECISLIYW